MTKYYVDNLYWVLIPETSLCSPCCWWNSPLLKSSTLDKQGAVQSIHVKLSTSIQIKYQLSLSQDLPIVPTNFRKDTVELVSTYHHRGHNRDFNYQHHHHDHHHLSWSSSPPLAVTVVIIIIIICNQPYRHYHNQLSLSWVSSSPSSCHLYNHHYIIIIKVVLGDIHLDNILNRTYTTLRLRIQSQMILLKN